MTPSLRRRMPHVHFTFLQRNVQSSYMIDRRLHVLRVVDQLGTITAAGASLHLTPPRCPSSCASWPTSWT